MRFITASGAAGLPIVSGRSSGVERNLAKVDVVSSNLIARSILRNQTSFENLIRGIKFSEELCLIYLTPRSGSGRTKSRRQVCRCMDSSQKFSRQWREFRKELCFLGLKPTLAPHVNIGGMSGSALAMAR